LGGAIYNIEILKRFGAEKLQGEYQIFNESITKVTFAMRSLSTA
jgi:hypothetical protein